MNKSFLPDLSINQYSPNGFSVDVIHSLPNLLQCQNISNGKDEGPRVLIAIHI